MKLYNTLSRKKEVFKALHGKEVGMYSCGPTVYWYQHIGNLRSYIFSDILKRVLIYNRYKVNHVMNVTDVGHLTNDSDMGDDKIEMAAVKEGKSVKELTNYYLKIFIEDMKKLNISNPENWAKATSHIKEQINMIKKLEEKGFTYKTKDGVYFDTTKLKDYGALAKLRVEKLKAGKRVKIGDKKNKTDFALWKFSIDGGGRLQEWKSPWGVGFPGWHIECSAMATKYLGEQFDIHTGGEDHIPVHHVNEIAQSESAIGKKPWVKYWLHGAFLNFGGEKMSKSSGRIATISELEEKGFNPLIFKYFILTAHYRTQLNFTFDNLTNAKNSYERLKRLVLEIKDSGVNKKYLGDFEGKINDDMDMPGALQVLWKLVKDTGVSGRRGVIEKIDQILGLDLLKVDKVKIPSEVMVKVKEREKARGDKDFEGSDRIRDELKEMGWKVDDASSGSDVKKI